MEELILRYGVILLFLGAGIEGEPFALAGGVLAHRHSLPVYGAVLAAIGGSCCIDQFWFHLSRYFSRTRIVRRVSERPAFQRAIELIESYPIRFVLLFRFAYGLRAVAPVAIGASRLPTWLFVPLNIVAAIVWGCLFTGLGYLAGPAFEQAEARYGKGIAIATVCLSVAVFVFVMRRGRPGK
ncbi:DedA family protein [Sphingomonas sp.]|uniref:DedA family protein n=1 Tax=Sphingomonas sp. TaxID=28214 RepID=UPI003B3A4E1E